MLRKVIVFLLVLFFPVLSQAQLQKVMVEKGESFVDSLVDHYISREEATLVAGALERYVNLHNVREGFQYFIDWENGIPVRLEIPYDVGVIYDVDLRTLDVMEKKGKVEIEKRVFVGVLKEGDSVFYSIYEKTGDTKLAYQFVSIFKHRIDFHTWTRPGDYYAFICEHLRDEFGNEKYGRILVAKYVGKKVKAEAVYYKGAYYDSKGYPLKGAFLASPIGVDSWLRAPLRYKRISSGYSWHRLHPILGIVRPHLGVDYAAPMGTPVKSVADGVVIYKGWYGGYGRLIKIKHKGGIVTQYAHLSRYAKGIKVGSRVRKGQVIGYVGMSGLATGPHLDFRIKVNGRFVNPLRFLARHSRVRVRRVVKRRLKGKALEYVKAQLDRLDERVALLMK